MGLHKYKLSTYAETKLLISTDSLPEPLLFREKLYVFDENGTRIGRFSLNVDQDDTTTTQPKVLFVHISNRAYTEGRLSETTVSGCITQKLKTLEEIRYEVTETSTSHKHERCLFLLREATKYYVSVTSSVCSFKRHSHATIPFVGAIGLMGECASAVLLRKLAFQGYEGILCLKGLLSNGKRCKNYYVTRLSERIINGTRMQVLIVYRTMTNHKKCNLTMTMALTRSGQLIYLFWSNSKCFLHIDPDVELRTDQVISGDSKLHKFWHKDIQLHSFYLDVMDQQKVTYKTYKTKHEELRKMLDDFLEYLLFLKPKDIICFAIEYFTAFGSDTARKCEASKTKMQSEQPSDVGSNLDMLSYKMDYKEMWRGETSFYDGHEHSSLPSTTSETK